MDRNDEICLGLDLGLGLSDQYTPKKRDHPQKNKRMFFLDLSIPIQASDHGADSSLKFLGKDEKIGSRNNNFSDCSKEDDDSNCSMNFSRKKLRLTRDQTTSLEDSFKQHTTLNTAQKQALAEKLNLKPRQVEVWFQNRRARTKLKQTEVDCEFLRKNCERLSEENWRLKKELLELRSYLKTEKPHQQPRPPPTAAMKPAPPSHIHHNPKAAAAEVSCEKIRKGRGGGDQKQEAAAAAVVEVVHEP